MTVNITNSNSAGSQGPLVDTGQVFVAAMTGGAGPSTAPVECHSIADITTAFGPRSTSSAVAALWDWADDFFHEGGNTIYAIGYATAGMYAPALALFDPRLGPGQVAVVNEPATAALYEAISTHCAANNRIGLLDVKSTDNTAALMETTAAFMGSAGASLPDATRVALFGSWLNIPAPVGVIGGTARTVPASASVAALCNRVDIAGNPGAAAGGRGFPYQYATSAVYDPTSTEQAALFTAGLNPQTLKYGVLENYGFWTPIGQSTATPFGQLSAARTRMWLTANAQVIGENYYMQEIDGQGVLAAQFGNDLAAMCHDLWVVGALYGDTAEDAYNVNVGVTINTQASAATGTLNATVEARLSQYAGTVNINLVSIPVAGQIQ